MDFASNYVLNYNVSDDECVSDDELEHGMTLSDSDDEVTISDTFDTLGQEEKKESSAQIPSPGEAGLVCDSASRSKVESAPPPPPAPAPRHFAKAFSGDSSSKKGNDRKKDGRFFQRKRSHWRSAPSKNVSSPSAISGRKWRRADTNIISIKFNTLIKPSQMHTGDPVTCKNCQALLSHISHIETDGSDQVWCCEYCSERNVVDVMPEEKPQQEDVTFMLEPALTTTTAGRSGTDQSLIVFCVDISGSMCVTTEVPGKLKLRGSNVLQRMQSFNEMHEDQHLPGEARNLTYVSRLQAVQAAVDFQLGELSKEHPNRRAALISFNNEVSVIGDGSSDPITLAGDKLTVKEELLKIGENLSLPGAVKNTRIPLGQKVFDLEEGGSTALGPALLVSIAMASQCPGSKVIMCTDGMANVGLGKLANDDTDEDSLGESESFYTYLAETAKQKGVSVSVISISGTDCKLAELGRVADITSGQVSIVDPLKLTEEFGNIIANPVIATNVKATLILHKGLYIRHEQTSDSRVTKEIGNVTAESEITFEFGVRTQPTAPVQAESVQPTPQMSTVEEKPEGGEDEASEGATANDCPPNSVDRLNEVPFQLQIAYNDMESNKAMRVLTKTRPVTKDRNLAEKAINVALVGAHTAQLASKFALEGNYTKSRLTAFMNQRLVSRYSHSNKSSREDYEMYVDLITPMESRLRLQQQTERSKYGVTYSDSEEDEDNQDSSGGKKEDKGASGSEVPKKKGILAKMKKSKSRKNECSDEMAYMNFNMRKFNTSSFEKN